MSQRRKFLEHFVFNGMLVWLGMIAGMMALLVQHPYVVPIVVTGSLGVIFLFISKWRFIKNEQYAKFGYKELQKFEKICYLMGYFFIACSVFASAVIYFAFKNPPA